MQSAKAVLSIERLRLMVRLGEWEPERAEPQPIELTVHFYFHDLPSACQDDDGEFICYDKVATRLSQLVASKEFRLIEFLCMQAHGVIREEIVSALGEAAAAKVGVRIRLHKVQVPIPEMVGGAAFEFRDYC